MNPNKTSHAVFAELDTTEPLREKARPKRAAPPAQASPPPVASADPLSLVYTTAEPPPAPRPSWLKRCRDILIGKGIGFCVWHILLPGLLNFGTISGILIGGAALLAKWGGYKMQKAPDTEQGRVVARLAGDEPPKPTLAQRVLEPMKEAAAKPIEAVKDGAKKTVAKAEEKASELKTEVQEQAGELKGAIQGLKTDSAPDAEDGFGGVQAQPQPPGLLESAKAKVVNVRNAVATQVGKAFPAGPELTPAQLRKQRDILSNQRIRAERTARRTVIQNQLGQMGAQIQNQAAALSEESNAQFNQDVSNALQGFSTGVQQYNRQRGGR